MFTQKVPENLPKLFPAIDELMGHPAAYVSDLDLDDLRLESHPPVLLTNCPQLKFVFASKKDCETFDLCVHDRREARQEQRGRSSSVAVPIVTSASANVPRSQKFTKAPVVYPLPNVIQSKSKKQILKPKELESLKPTMTPVIFRDPFYSGLHILSNLF